MADHPQWVEAAPTLEQLEQAARENPNDLDAHRRYGWALYGVHRYEEAIQVLDAAREKHPSDAEILYALALSLKQAGDKVRAAQMFRQVIDHLDTIENPTRASMLKRLSLGNINYLERGTWDLQTVA